MLRDAVFEMDELYFTGVHVGGPSDTAELEALMTQTLVSGGVDAYAVEMATLGTGTTYATGDTVHWQVEVVVLDAQWQTMQDYHASSSLVTFFSGAAHNLQGTTHVDSGFEMIGSLTAGDPYAGSAPSPPSAYGRE